MSFDLHSGILDVDDFRRDIQHVFQQTESVLRANVNNTVIATGTGTYFPLIGATSSMNERSGDGEIPFSTRTNSRVQVTLTPKYLKDQILMEDLQYSQVEPRTAVLQSQRMSRDREFDQTILTALDATTQSYTLKNGSYLTWADIRAMRAQLRRQNVPTDGVIFLLSPDQFSQMMNIEELTSGDYSNDKRLANPMGVWNALGMTFIEHTELSGVGTSTAKCFAYNKMAVGHALPGGVAAEQIKIQEDGPNFRHLIATSLFHGAGIIQNEGVIEFSADDEAAQAD